MIQEFKDFINKGSIVELAVAVVLATAFAPIITRVITFLCVALAVFYVLKAHNATKADEEEGDSGPSEVDLLTEIRDSLANR